ncbi:SDR family NAD(P)-dependent oxidoreductase, partial [Bradyrhizobium sp. SHOUNA76]|uniref:SDR family NAD(P)-dependent oxidoreductase n=1 Tax=Bradyrhizobium sp. SHOUNA76 TaxID=2908927 RepID=UPI001FF16481
MEPDLEVVQIRRGESFKAWSHGYPFHTVRWHFHPEYELHQVVATSGRYFIGEFEPGNLVLTGPNLPHNWVSDLPPGSTIPLRGRILQFSEEFIGDLTKVMPELSGLAALLEFSRRGALFTRSASDKIAPLMEEIATANGVRRIEPFLMILGTLSRVRSAHPLSSPNYLPDPSGYMSAGMNKALARAEEALSKACVELGDQAIPLRIDLTDPESMRALMPQVLEKAGPLDIFHANAGAYVGGEVLGGDPDAWDRMLRDRARRNQAGSGPDGGGCGRSPA